MSKNVYQFMDVERIDPPKKSIEQRKIDFVEIYRPLKIDPKQARLLRAERAKNKKR